jgi:DNA polymerase III subunit delta'
MPWQSILQHQTQYEWFRNALIQQRLATSFLFLGPEGIGKRTFARMLAQSLLCRAMASDQLNACGQCEDCAQVMASTHPDLIQIAKPPEKSSLPLELLIGEKENRMQEGLCHDISLKPFSGRRKIAIIDDADYLHAEGANALLKTLEEPPKKSVLILIGTSLQRQLPTIRSRCQTVLFQPLSTNQLAQLLVEQGVVDNEAAAVALAAISNGSIALAKLLHDPDLHAFRDSLLEKLSASKINLAEISKMCGEIVDAAGKEGKYKRDRLKLILGFAAQFYRELAMLDWSAAVSPAAELDQSLSAAVARTRTFWSRGTEAAVACWNICLRSIEHVDRNVNQASLLEWWVAQLAEQSGC